MSKFIENLYLDCFDIFSWKVCRATLSSIDRRKPMQSKENRMKANAWKITDFERNRNGNIGAVISSACKLTITPNMNITASTFVSVSLLTISNTVIRPFEAKLD